MGKKGRKVLQKEKVIKCILEYVEEHKQPPTRQAIVKSFPPQNGATVYRRLDEAHKAGDIVGFIDGKSDYVLPISVEELQKKPRLVVTALPPDKVYTVATEFFRGNNVQQISKSTKVDESLAMALEAYIQKEKIQTPKSFTTKIPLPALDQRVLTYLTEHGHASRPELMTTHGLEEAADIKPTMKRLGFFEDVSYVHGSRAIKVYFYWPNVKDLDTEVYPYISQRASQQLRALETKLGPIYEHDILAALGFETVSRDYNKVAQHLLPLLRAKREKTIKEGSERDLSLVPESPVQHLPSQEELLATRLAEEVSKKYYTGKELSKLARRITKKEMDLETLTTFLSTHGYELQHRENLHMLPSPLKKRYTPLRFTWLSEVAFDSDLFNPEPFENWKKKMSRYKDLAAVFIDGAVTRPDRPEVLCDDITFWFKSEEECEMEAKDPNNRKYMTLLDKQLDILETHFKEIRKALPGVSLYYQLPSEGLQDAVSTIVNQVLVQRKEEAIGAIKKYKADKQQLEHEYKGKLKEYDHVVDDTEKLLQEMRTMQEKIGELEAMIAAPEQHNVDAAHLKSAKAEKRKLEKEHLAKQKAYEQQEIKKAQLAEEWANYERKIKEAELLLDLPTKQKQGLSRPNKRHPAHQFTTTQIVQHIMDKYKKVCDAAGVTLLRYSTEIVTIDGVTLKIMNRIDPLSWAVLKHPEKRLRDIVLADQKKNIDVVAISGHYGTGYKCSQRLRYSVAQVNHEVRKFDASLDDKVRIGLTVLPFEDGEKAQRYLDGKEPERLGGGIPRGTRSHAAFTRRKYGGHSGATIITRTEDGVIGTEWIPYKDFVTGKILDQLDTNSVIYVTSDEHIGSPEEDRLGLDGVKAVYASHVKNPTTFDGKPAFARGFINGGDGTEANSKKWTYRQEHRADPDQDFKEIEEKLFSLDQKDPLAIVETTKWLANKIHTGKINSMNVMETHFANYVMDNFEQTLQYSPLQAASIVIPGNHADDVNHETGKNELNLLVARVREREWQLHDERKEKMPVYVVGEDGEKERREARLLAGGYDIARIINLDDYGKAVDGSYLFGPINIVLHHDPKGSGFSGLEGIGRKVGADLAIAGHTHETWVKLYGDTPNEFSIAYRVATMQNPGPVELLFASGPPRTQAGHRFMIPEQGIFHGHFYEETLPIAYLRAEGERALRDEAKWQVAMQKKQKK